MILLTFLSPVICHGPPRFEQLQKRPNRKHFKRFLILTCFWFHTRRSTVMLTLQDVQVNGSNFQGWLNFQLEYCCPLSNKNQSVTFKVHLIIMYLPQRRQIFDDILQIRRKSCIDSTLWTVYPADNRSLRTLANILKNQHSDSLHNHSRKKVQQTTLFERSVTANGPKLFKKLQFADELAE